MHRTVKRLTMTNITVFLSRLRAIRLISCGLEISPSSGLSKVSCHGIRGIHQNRKITRIAGNTSDLVDLPTDARAIPQDYLLLTTAGLECKQIVGKKCSSSSKVCTEECFLAVL